MSKYNKYNIIFSLIVLLIGGICYTLIIRWLLTRQLNADVMQEKSEILEFVQLNKVLPPPMSFKGQSVSYQKAEKIFKEHLRNEYLFVNLPHKSRPHFRIFRTLTFPVVVNGILYKGTIRKSQAETEDMVQLLVGCTFVLAILLLLGFGLSNRLMLNKLWNPFYRTLKQLEYFKLSDGKNIQLEKTDIEEFATLNRAVLSMTSQAEKEYIALKYFTENASHEIQTPLAIIKSKLELLMQSDQLSKSDSENITSAFEATVRLSRLNAALLLLTRIENKQYTHTAKIELVPIIHALLQQYDDLIKAGDITLQLDLQENPWANMDESLAEILIGNIIRNAIRHNQDKGFISIRTQSHSIEISNPGIELHEPTENMFRRFQKESQSSKSLGLGLAIAKKIADQYHFSLQYIYLNGIHTLRLDLNPNKENPIRS